MDNRTHILIERFLGHQLNEDELLELKDILKHSSETKQELANAMHMRGLIASSHGDDYNTLIQHLDDAIDTLMPSRFEDHVIKEIDEKELTNRKRFMFTWAIAIAAQIVVAFSMYLLWKPSPMINVAQVTTCSGSAFLVRNESKISMSAGMDLFSGDQIFIQQDGRAKIHYPDQSEIILYDQSYIKLIDHKGAKLIYLYAGVLRGNIHKQLQQKPMRIITEDSTATVLGTRFEINSSEVSTLLEVDEGLVRMEQCDDSVVDVNPDRFAISKHHEGISLREVGTPLFCSDLITTETPGQGVDIEVNIQGAEKLYLVTNNGGDGNRFDHVVWLNPELIGSEHIDLTDLKWSLEKSGWISSQVNKGPFGGSIRVAGEIYDCGISTHATSVIAYNLPPGCRIFRCRAALLDSGTKQPFSVSSVKFEVYTQLPEQKLQKLQIRKRFY